MKRLVFLAVPVLLLAGCGSSGNTAGPAPVPSAPATSPATESPSPLASPSTGTTATTGPASPTSRPATPRCRTADLSVRTGEGDAAAGSRSVDLVFGNKSDRACTLFGYPGVSWVAGDNGTQVNEAFSREAGQSGKRTVTVEPGGVVYSLVIWPISANFDAGQCKPVEVRGYRVYPPDETASIFVSGPQTVCSAKGVGTGRVHPVSTRES
ncbi:DUF4232 domain-containing protein [Paractinoplanes maris]|uniref:DUF4232 domain-containing protein n=1 Tax=Paractinoplanes maris TaxID=1734446 RepID=UPI00202200E9|nr:DUF4232 domain-containing protein [Actinoplanes maris]